MTWKNKHKDVLILYDWDGKEIARQLFICRACGIKHCPRTTPACMQDHSGKVVWSNVHYDKIKHKVKK